MKNGYIVKETVYATDLTVIIIDYPEKNQFHALLWAKEARGRAYAVFNSKIYELKVSLIRGIELPTQYHESFIDTAQLDPHQKQIIKLFKLGSP